MPCFKPLKGYRALRPNPSGKYSTTFNLREGYKDQPRELRCGQCRGCRLEYARQWAIRCLHEASLYTQNTFITLTYNDQHLPSPPTLTLTHFQKFIKKLRSHSRRVERKLGLNHHPIRFFHCGEYGEKNFRPHYHAIIFNYDFPDKVETSVSPYDDKIIYYESELLKKLWPYGISKIGDVTFQSASYVARYIMKKQNGKDSEKYYEMPPDEHGEIHTLKKEYTTMSRRPGIGKEWWDKYKKDVYPHNFIVYNGKKMSPPKFYRAQYEIEDPKGFEKTKAIAKGAAKKHEANNTWERLEVREEVLRLKTETLKRNV